ncbi:MAG TPA: hypothetical protein DIU15_20275 [Deltaproteobacteria bacterium]|nr:hypothetical protein [Deltaproteobacteria bacterium]HCP48386.1 hypothetical protein [Deltaproteobacteria bacterium]
MTTSRWQGTGKALLVVLFVGATMYTVPRPQALAHSIDSDELAAPPQAPGMSAHSDPDLTLNKTCPGKASASQLTSRLPSYAKELVLLWPRTGKRMDNGSCVTVSRLTVINHQGTPLTVSFLQYERPVPDTPRDFRLLENQTPPRAVFEVLPEESHPQILVEVAGSPSTSRDTLEAVLDFLDAQAAVLALIDNGERPAKVPKP